MEIILAAMENELADAWQSQCAQLADVRIHRGSIFDVAADALVSPANSFGFMDGGIDYQYSKHFGWDLQLKLRRLILDRHHGELLVGQAECVETGDRHPYLIAAPTMRVPMYLGETTVAPYLATRAALLLIKHGATPIQSVAFPGMGTGVGRVPAAICARQMRQAIIDVQSRAGLPSSWAEASENHQLLYTDTPKRLQ